MLRYPSFYLTKNSPLIISYWILEVIARNYRSFFLSRGNKCWMPSISHRLGPEEICMMPLRVHPTQMFWPNDICLSRIETLTPIFRITFCGHIRVQHMPSPTYSLLAATRSNLDSRVSTWKDIIRSRSCITNFGKVSEILHFCGSF